MRILVLLVSMVIVSLLVMKGYSGRQDESADGHAWKKQTDTIKKAEDVNRLIQDAADIQRQALEKQIQQ